MRLSTQTILERRLEFVKQVSFRPGSINSRSRVSYNPNDGRFVAFQADGQGEQAVIPGTIL